MKFARLRLVGFKSFTDPVELVLEPGLTGVVGPNGCGKSNLVEALRFVMGESSYKAMRGAGMDDVIFSGSANRPARNSAEVTVVLDNADRTAPALFNTGDVIEVSRRIERESGSVYRINGREVRARDVQLLFADASTGAHSPALVRQGQIGELIAAKPTQRRALLEEAAGISGLHSRRHEAELRLRAAEANLERVDDIVAQIEGQLESLKRQARQATRYRALSGDIRKAEATLSHLRWVAARYAEKQTEAEQGRLIAQLAEANHLNLAAERVHGEKNALLAPLREADARAAALVQRLIVAREQLEAEVRRSDQRRTELAERRTQIATDLAREQALITESEATLAALGAERDDLTGASQEDNAASHSARAEAAAARTALEAAEAAAQDAGAALAQVRAARVVADRTLAEAAARVDRIARQHEDVRRDAEAVEASLSADQTLAARQHALAFARSALADTEAALDAAESAATLAQTSSAAAQPALFDLEAGLARLEGEADTLSRLLGMDGTGLWPTLVDTLTVAPGFETALGAALGDDLEASTDGAAPIHWAGAAPQTVDPALPDGVEPLADRVVGPPALARRLAQIGVVAPEDGARLMARLAPGQRLVSRAGASWRWDGLVAAADAPSAAAQRLAQRNRLTDLDREIADMRTRGAAARAQAEALAGALERAREAESDARARQREAQRVLTAAQAGLDAAEKDQAKLSARKNALAETMARVGEGLAEARAEHDIAAQARAAIPPEGEAATTAEAAQRAVAGLRADSQHAAARLAGFESAARLRSARLARIADDVASWTRRRASADIQIATLLARRDEIDAQTAELRTSPYALAGQRATLDDQIDAGEATRKRAADALSRGETEAREADRALRLAADALAGARAELARIEERLKGHIAKRHEIERAIADALGVPASRTAEIAGLRPEHPLPGADETERRLDRLKSERERLGGVNLRAEEEARDVEAGRDKMVADREDLVAAIAKLRTGISNLNREGRARLTEAFDRVNAHFRELFTTLFGGGTAELTFVESDDPLEAGLEIIAKPPGKKPQTMTLLSGGEQALTALSLIFAVFLTNPAPICVLDEVDAPLDDANVERFCRLLASMRARTDTRFMVITHNPITMSRVDRLFGVTMPERGVSQLVSVDLSVAEGFREAV